MRRFAPRVEVAVLAEFVLRLAHVVMGALDRRLGRRKAASRVEDVIGGDEMPGEQRNDTVEILLVVGGVGFELLLARLVGMDRVLERVYLEIGQREACLGAFERRLVRPRIDHEEQRAFGYVLVVVNWQFDDRAAHVRRDADDVGPHISVVGARVNVVEAQNVEADHDRADDD